MSYYVNIELQPAENLNVLIARLKWVAEEMGGDAEWNGNDDGAIYVRAGDREYCISPDRNLTDERGDLK